MLEVLERFNKISWIITIIFGITIFYVSSLQFKTYSKTTSDLSIIYHHGDKNERGHKKIYEFCDYRRDGKQEAREIDLCDDGLVSNQRGASV